MALSRDEKIAQLQKIPVFQGCSRQQLVAVARIVDITDVPAGKALTLTGETGSDFSIILDGTARVGVWGRKRVRLGPGDFFGEMSPGRRTLLGDSGRGDPASVVGDPPPGVLDSSHQASRPDPSDSGDPFPARAAS